MTDCKTDCNIDPGVGIKCYKTQWKTLWKGKTILKENWFQSLTVILSYPCTQKPQNARVQIVRPVSLVLLYEVQGMTAVKFSLHLLGSLG